MKTKVLVYSNECYIGYTYDLFSDEVLEIGVKELKIDLRKYSLEQYTRNYYSDSNSYEVIKISDTLFKIVSLDFNGSYFYLSFLSEEEILRQIKKDRLERL